MATNPNGLLPLLDHEVARHGEEHCPGFSPLDPVRLPLRHVDPRGPISQELELAPIEA
jgi:hypothetical protein